MQWCLIPTWHSFLIRNASGNTQTQTRKKMAAGMRVGLATFSWLEGQATAASLGSAFVAPLNGRTSIDHGCFCRWGRLQPTSTWFYIPIISTTTASFIRYMLIIFLSWSSDAWRLVFGWFQDGVLAASNIHYTCCNASVWHLFTILWRLYFKCLTSVFDAIM